MISYDPSFEVEQLMAGQPGLQWPVGTVLTVKTTNSVTHDGNYTCAPSTLTTDSVIVHIIDEGKIPPVYAVYGDSSRAFQTPISTKLGLAMVYLLLSTVWWRHFCHGEQKNLVWKLEIQASQIDENKWCSLSFPMFCVEIRVTGVSTTNA